MKFAFFGTPEFAAIILEKLIKAGLVPALVVCNPDKPAGRKKIITSPPTKVLAKQNNIPIWQPEKLEIEDYKLKITEMDFVIVAAYAKILPKEVINIPRLGTIGVHPSLLPKYRGPTPIQSVILKGEKETGTTLFLLDEKVDHGPILAKSKIQTSLAGQVKSKSYTELQNELAELSTNLLIEILPKFVRGEIKPMLQNESEATYTKKFRTEDGYIDPDILRQAQDGTNLKEAELIERKIKALNPEPGIYTIQNSKRLKILEAELKNEKLVLKKIQIDGGKPKELFP